MSEQQIEFTGFEDYIPDDRPRLYLTGGSGNLPGTPEIHLTFLDPEDGEERPLGWLPVTALRAALDALEPRKDPS